MDKDRSNHVGLPLFMEGCKALGYEDEEEAVSSVSYIVFFMRRAELRVWKENQSL